MSYQTILKDAQATDEFGHMLAHALKSYLQKNSNKSCLIFLQGELGAGKTSLVRACLRSLGIQGAIKSPTYTLLEPYEVVFENSSQELSGLKIAHLDLYRLHEPEELDYIGGRDLKDAYQLIFVEWPQNALSAMPGYDIKIQLNHIDSARELILETRLAELIKELNL